MSIREARGEGAIELVMALKQLGFSAAVELLQTQLGNIIALEAKRPTVQQLQIVEEPRKPRNKPHGNTASKST
jgi:hypothetical protein